MLVKAGKFVCLVAFCVFFFCFLFVLFLIFTFFLLSLLHHNKTFSTNIHRAPIVRRRKKSSRRCNDEAKPFTCTALCSMALASVRPADTVLCFFFYPPLPPVKLFLSFLIALNVVTLQAKST